MTKTTKISIGKIPTTGNFLMRIPADAMPALYEMLQAAPLNARRWFYQVKQKIEEKYPECMTVNKTKE